MSGTITSTAAWIDETGIHAPTYNEILDYLKSKYRAIYGDDIYLENDSQDGQALALQASGINDANSMAVAVYNSQSPATAQHAALSSLVKLNGIARQVSSQSTAQALIVGVAGTVISNGVASDSARNRWLLPSSVTIEQSGEVLVMITAKDTGNITAQANTINQIATPTRGWQSITNISAAVSGAPVETNLQLRQRQTRSVALPSLTVLDGIDGAVAAVAGVTLSKIYENPTGAVDSNGLPPHSIALVVTGGAPSDIANAIFIKKTPGCFTYGSTAFNLIDRYGIGNTINYFITEQIAVNVAITLKALNGYASSIGDAVKTAVADYITTSGIGERVMQSRIYLPANLNGNVDSRTFEITSLVLVGGSPDLVIAFNQKAICSAANVAITVV